jgi:hypothetical protein
MAEFAREEISELQGQIRDLEKQLSLLLLPRDPLDDKDIMLEIRWACFSAIFLDRRLQIASDGTCWECKAQIVGRLFLQTCLQHGRLVGVPPLCGTSACCPCPGHGRGMQSLSCAQA